MSRRVPVAAPRGRVEVAGVKAGERVLDIADLVVLRAAWVNAPERQALARRAVERRQHLVHWHCASALYTIDMCDHSYDRPIAVLTGPSAASSGDQVALRMNLQSVPSPGEARPGPPLRKTGLVPFSAVEGG